MRASSSKGFKEVVNPEENDAMRRSFISHDIHKNSIHTVNADTSNKTLLHNRHGLILIDNQFQNNTTDQLSTSFNDDYIGTSKSMSTSKTNQYSRQLVNLSKQPSRNQVEEFWDSKNTGEPLPYFKFCRSCNKKNEHYIGNKECINGVKIDQDVPTRRKY